MQKKHLWVLVTSIAMLTQSALCEPEKLTPVQQDWLARSGKAADSGYLEECTKLRQERLADLSKSVPAIVFLENIEFGNAPRLNMSLSDGPFKGNPFKAGAAIRILRFDQNGNSSVEDLLRDPNGMIRDLDVSFDGKRILFSWKKSQLQDDYHIYEMTVAAKKIRQVTKETGVADIQGRYLPDGRIIYHSTRCVNVVDCNESIDVVNLYTCDLNGENILRLGYDQVSTQYPNVLADGRIIYTRWEYNDRGQIYPQALFTMNPDGSHQKALYGNNSWYPTSLIQARAIPGSSKVVAIAAGHHTPPNGKLVTVDVTQGREEGDGVQLLSPVRKLKYIQKDKADQDEALFQYPFALSETEFIIGYSMFGERSSKHFGIYWINQDGERELLASDPEKSYRSPMPLAPRKVPPVRPSALDYTKDYGTFYIENIYSGRGLPGIKPGTVKKLRVIALDFRAAAVGRNENQGEGGHARVCTPVSISGAWDIKRIIGDVIVHQDGSVLFNAPARTALYFQAIDEEGRAIQSMRSWVTLMPGESYSCIGCHDDKNASPATSRSGSSTAMREGPQELQPFYGQTEGFSFLKGVQPILDEHCIKCHAGDIYKGEIKNKAGKVFSLKGTPVKDLKAKRQWTESYISLLQTMDNKGNIKKYCNSNSFINWLSPQGRPTVMNPYSFGAATSKIFKLLQDGHKDKKGERRVNLSREELDRIACWIDLAVPFCGDYKEAGLWSEKDLKWYEKHEAKQSRLRKTEWK